MPRNYSIADQIIITPCDPPEGAGPEGGGKLWVRIETRNMRFAPGSVIILFDQVDVLIDTLLRMQADWRDHEFGPSEPRPLPMKGRT